MTSTFSENLMSSTYKDDFSDSAGFKRILFNPRRALQARELTQSQTIIQKDIERFGRNIFKDGAMVNPGGITLNAGIEFIKLDPTDNNTPDSFPNASALEGLTFTGSTSGVTARIIQVIDGVAGDLTNNPPTLYVIYTGSGSITPTNSAIKFTPGETITSSTISYVTQTTNTTSNPAIGTGIRVSIAGGDYFTQGFFCHAKSQSLMASKYSNNYTGVVGFKVIQEIVTASDDDTLFDNQGAFPNVAAPGADRFRINLSIIDQANIGPLDTFVFVANIVKSAVVEQATGFNQYNKINDMVAQRTAEESGDYLVNPYFMTYDSSSALTLSAVLSPGKAYVNGHRINHPVSTELAVNKALTTNLDVLPAGSVLSNSSIAVEYGSYVIASAIEGALPMDGNGTKTTYPLVEIHNNTTPSGAGTTIGTCRIRHVDQLGSNYRLFIFDVNMTSSFRNAKTLVFGSDDTHFATLVLESSVAVLKEASENNLLFPLPVNRPKTITGMSFSAQRKYTGTASGGGSIVFTSPAAGETFSNANDWVVMSNGVKLANSAWGISAGGVATQSVTISGSGISAGHAVEAIVYIQQSAVIRTKTITPVTSTIAIDGSTFIAPLGRNDIIEMVTIREGSSGGDDVSDQFTFDNGQRDGFYEQGQLIRKSTSSLTGNLYVEFTHYSHSSGNCFAVNSYPAPYGSIPSHRLRDGSIIELRDVLDFRSAKKADGTFDDAGGAAGGVLSELPQNDTIIIAKVEHFLPRQDRIVVGEDGVIKNLEGVSSILPKLPYLPPKHLELYRTSLNGGTTSISDLTVQYMENKGYTMRDIGKIDKRVDLLEETVALSLLELDTNQLEVLDGSGNNRTKSGFLVDNFKDQFHADTSNDEYKASINPKTMTLHPAFTETNVGMIYDDTASTNTVLKGDNVYLAHTHSAYISQSHVSRTENVNPFMSSSYTGSITLSPQSDEWKVDKNAAAKIIDGGTRLNTNQAQIHDQSEWGWLGTDINGLEIGDQTSAIAGTQQTSTSFFSQLSNEWITSGFDRTTSAIVNRVVASETIRTSLGSKIIDIALIPFMRSRRVFFEAVGIRPNSQMFAYLNGKKINDFVKSENFSRINSGRVEYESPNLLTAHPAGASTLVSSSAGTVTGSFFIPCNSTTKFRTGSAEFKLLDVTETFENGGTPGSSAVATYQSAGHIQTWQEEIMSTRHLTVVGTRVTTGSSRVIVRNESRDRRSDRPDPLAQSFFITNPDGVYTTKVEVFFKTKDSTLPVWIELRPLVNGYPASNTILPGSRKYLNPSAVSISDDASIPTTFEFDEPIFLSGNTEYAVVVITDNTSYNLWTSFMGDFELGSTSARITKQPFMGSFFKSQNSTTWEASQEQDMKFVLYRAVFSSLTGEVYLKNADLPLAQLSANPIITTAGSASVRVMHKNHNLFVGDKVTLAGAGTSAIGTITQSQINTTHTITHVDPTGYKFTCAGVTAGNVTAAKGGDGAMTATKNIQGNTVHPIVQTIAPSNTSVTASGKFYSGYSHVALETPYQAPVDPQGNALGYSSIALNQKNFFDDPIMIAAATKEDAAISDGGLGNIDTASIKIAYTTGNNFVSPVVDLQRCSLVLTKNEIDRPIGSATAGYNVVFDYAAETTPFSGSALSKHITKPITLVNTAVGLKILLGANRPAGSIIDIYYKTGTEDTELSSTNWTLAPIDTPVSISDNPSVYKEYSYLIGGDNGTVEAFTTFQIKIVFYANNSSKVPTVKDLRVIALGV